MDCWKVYVLLIFSPNDLSSDRLVDVYDYILFNQQPESKFWILSILGRVAWCMLLNYIQPANRIDILNPFCLVFGRLCWCMLLHYWQPATTITILNPFCLWKGGLIDACYYILYNQQPESESLSHSTTAYTLLSSSPTKSYSHISHKTPAVWAIVSHTHPTVHPNIKAWKNGKEKRSLNLRAPSFQVHTHTNQASLTSAFY